MMKRSRPHAIVLGLSPTGLYVARELGRSGTPLLGVDSSFGSAGASRYFRKSDGVWIEKDRGRLLERLLTYAGEADDKAVLIPTSDYYIEFLVDHYLQLKPKFRIAPCYAGIAMTLLDKRQFYELCARHNVATPGMWELANVQEWDQLDDIPYPCILKPALIHLAKPYMKGKKLFIVDSRDDLQALVKRLPPETGSWLVQEVIPGEESRITLMAGYTGTRDVANDAFTARKLRQYPPGFGSASRVISETCDETRSISEALMHAIGFIGVYGAEFKRDPRDGILKIIEINPRPALWFYLSHAAGKQLVERAYCELVGLPLPERNKQRDGIVWQYALKDFVSSMFYRFRSKEFILGAPDQSRGGAVRGRCWPVFSLTDPMPFFAELGVYLIKYFRRLF